ncbi:MAG: hypothetical protein LBG60_11985 [Bifidobacteriaceae bacterium]|jgi:hypothetical protein|nr:hypothetical protein [Bifidobacteriaceae bacterium]
MSSARPGGTRPRAWREATIEAAITRERLSSYMAAASGDLGLALELYDWNARAAGAVLQTTALVEVVARNALDRGMAAWAAAKRRNASWFDTAPLDTQGSEVLAAARARATRRGRDPEQRGKVVAELPFGFWRYLLARRYLTVLWLPSLAAVFPHGNPNPTLRRSQVERAMSAAVFLRNRAAHGEPVHRRDLLTDYRSMVELCAWIDAELGTWVADISTMPGLAADRARLGI